MDHREIFVRELRAQVGAVIGNLRERFSFYKIEPAVVLVGLVLAGLDHCRYEGTSDGAFVAALRSLASQMSRFEPIAPTPSDLPGAYESVALSRRLDNTDNH